MRHRYVQILAASYLLLFFVSSDADACSPVPKDPSADAPEDWFVCATIDDCDVAYYENCGIPAAAAEQCIEPYQKFLAQQPIGCQGRKADIKKDRSRIRCIEGKCTLAEEISNGTQPPQQSIPAENQKLE